MAKRRILRGIVILIAVGAVSALLVWGYSYSTARRCTLNFYVSSPGPDYPGAPDLAKFAIAPDGSIYTISGTTGLTTEYVTKYVASLPDYYSAVNAWPVINKEGRNSAEMGCRGIASDNAGNVYILLATSPETTEIRKFSSTGESLEQWRLHDKRGKDYAGQDMTVSPTGDMYVCENGAVFKYDGEGTLTDFAPGLTGAFALAIDTDGFSYVLCREPSLLHDDHLVHRLDPELNYIEGWGHEGQYPFIDGWGGLEVDPGGNVVIGFYFVAGSPENAYVFDPHGSQIMGLSFPVDAVDAGFAMQSNRIFRLTTDNYFDLFYIELSNSQPTASDQLAVSEKGAQVDIELPAADDDDDPLLFSIVDPPRHGTVSGAGGHVTYRPEGGYSGTDSFTFKAQDFDAYRSSNIANVDIRVTAEEEPGALVVTPEYELNSAGERGGPFTPSSVIYTVQNTSGTTLSWTVSKVASWVTLSSGGGTLAPGASALVSVAINSDAKALAAGIYTDTVFFTNTTNASGNTTRAVTLTVNSTGFMSVTPSMGLTSSGLLGGPFSPVSLIYTIKNTGGGPITWTVSKTKDWITLSSGGGSLAPGASALVSVEINSNAELLGLGTYTDTVTFVNTENALGNATRAVTLTVYATGVLEVTPAFDLNSSGAVGGPFSPISVIYTVKNTGGSRLSWTVAKAQTWVTLSSGGGSLDPGASALVSVEINSNANLLAAGSYADTLTFTNTTNASGSTTRGVSLTVTSTTPPTLAVTPAASLSSSGTQGGPFTPGSQTYTLQNTGGVMLTWTALKTQTWTTLSATAGTLAPGASATVTVSINAAANALAAGTYNDTVIFTNTTNGRGDTTRLVALTVNSQINTPPVANAGANQPNVSAGSNCMAAVTLNGSGSFDRDGDPLTYKWTWNGGSASGVSPTVQLPLGSTTITLIVNDGKADSAPANVDITVSDLTPPTLQLSDPVCAVGPAGQKANKFTVSAADDCSSPAVPTIVNIELYNSRGALVRGRGIYAISGTDIFVYSNNSFSIRVWATAVDKRGNSTMQTWQKLLVKCK